MSMRLPQRPIRQLDELSPGLRSLGLANLSTQGCALPAVDGTRAHYYRLDVLAELLERFASDETKAALIQTCNEASRTNAKWWFCPREEAIDVIENATLTRMALQPVGAILTYIPLAPTELLAQQGSPEVDGETESD